MQGKPGVNKWNLIAIPLLVMLTLASDADIIQEVPYLLQDVDFFDLTQAEANVLNTNAATISNFVTIPCLLLTGVIFDVVGRRPTIVGLLILGAISTILMPFSRNSKPFFIALRAGI